MATAVWKGSISFGLVSIPVRLYPAARPSTIGLHLLHSTCHTRLRQPLFCPTHNRIVDRSEVVKGYEYEKDKYVLIDPEDVKKIQPESASTMEILSFAKSSEIDPLYFDSSFFVVPEGQGRKAYQLLLRAIGGSERVGIAKVAMHQREYTVFIRPYDHGLVLHTMYFANEVRKAPGYGEVDGIRVTPQEVKLAQQLVSTLSKPFDVKQYHDEYQQRLKALIEAREKGEEIAAVPQPKRARVIDIMSALKKSLASTGPPKQHAQAKPGPARTTARHRRHSAQRAAS
jgi:DNA end-binding protein Ku